MATSLAVLVLAGCGTKSTTHTTDATVPNIVAPPPVKAHPQAVEPVAGTAVPTGRGSASADPGPSGSLAPAPHGAPTGPATVTDAPSAGAPTDAEVRAAIARFKAAVVRYHLDQLNYNAYLINPPPGQYNVSIASVFTDYGLPIACGGVLHPPDLGVANKTLPCGTMVTFVYSNRAIRIPVLDRGPYIAGREWDLTGAAAEALRFPGLGPIQWRIG